MENYLIHYGRLGQKWGVRNGPPYPLRDSVGKPITNSYYKSLMDSPHSSQRVGVLPASLVAIGTTAAITLLGKGVDVIKDKIQDKVYQIKDTESVIAELNIRKKYDDFSEIPENPSNNANSYIKEINAGDINDKYVSMNCVLCTTALALREKGYKVNAESMIVGIFPKEFYNETFSGSKYGKIKAKNSVEFVDQLNKLGDGAYGHLSVTWKEGGAHSLFFKIDKGKLRIYDGQAGVEIKYDTDPRFFQAIEIDQSDYIRLDMAKPNKKVLGAIR